MTRCKICGKECKPLGIMSHRRVHEKPKEQTKLEVDFSIRKKENPNE
jgi:hypothetical protein